MTSYSQRLYEVPWQNILDRIFTLLHSFQCDELENEHLASTFKQFNKLGPNASKVWCLLSYSFIICQTNVNDIYLMEAVFFLLLNELSPKAWPCNKPTLHEQFSRFTLFSYNRVFCYKRSVLSDIVFRILGLGFKQINPSSGKYVWVFISLRIYQLYDAYLTQLV